MTMEMQGDNYVTLSTAVLVREELYLAIQDKEGDSAILKQVKKLMRGKWDTRLVNNAIHIGPVCAGSCFLFKLTIFLFFMI